MSVTDAPTPALSPAERDRLAAAFADLASKAGVAVMEVYATDFEVRTKDDKSPVSDADERAEAIILEGLKTIAPGVAVLAEEAISAGGARPARDADPLVLVDPVDGTKEFVRRTGSFTVNIALAAGGTPVAGAVYAPAINRMYWGGATAYVADLTPGQTLSQVNPEPLATRAYPADGLDAVASSSHMDDQTKAFLDAMPIRGTTQAGSSLKFCRVAEGAADVYPRFGPTCEWDTAAGDAVLRAAGGRTLTPDGAPFPYAKHDVDFLNGPFIAWGRNPLTP